MPTSSKRTVSERLQTRLDHLERLESHQHGLTIKQANAAFQAVWDDSPKPDAIVLRRRFLRRATFLDVAGDRDKTPRPKPPLANLIRSRGVLLKLELTLLFLAQCQEPHHFTPKVRYPVIGAGEEMGLIDFFSTGTNRREGTHFKRMPSSMRARQVEGALSSLNGADLQLVDVTLNAKGRHDYDHGVTLHAEVSPAIIGGAKPYWRPSAANPGPDPLVAIPVEFFTNGWIHVLSDSEIANWLMWRDVAKMRDANAVSADGLRLSAHDRLGWYDLSRDTWDTHQTLDRMNLMTVTFADGRREDGTLEDFSEGERGSPHHFGLDDSALAKPALQAAYDAIAALKDEADRR